RSLSSLLRLAAPPDLPSFPTRRSSDLGQPAPTLGAVAEALRAAARGTGTRAELRSLGERWEASRGGCVGPTGFSGSCTGQRASRSEEHTSELQSRFDLVCRLLLEKKKY